MPDSIYEELLDFTIELDCDNPLYYVSIELVEACLYPAYLFVECSGNISCEKLDCDNTSFLFCGSEVSSTTRNIEDNVTRYCGNNTGYTGGEVVYTIIPRISQSYTFVLSDVAQGADLDMFLLNSCEQEDCLATTDGNSSDVITYYLNVNNTYYLVVDADEIEGNGNSDFDLKVTGCCSTLPDTDNNFIIIPKSENTLALKFIENGNPLASGATDISWTLGNRNINQVSCPEGFIYDPITGNCFHCISESCDEDRFIEVTTDSEKLERLCVSWQKEEIGLTIPPTFQCYTQCKDICFPIDYSCDLISLVLSGNPENDYQFSIPDQYYVSSWLLHDGGTQIEFRDNDISNRIVFENLEEGKDYDVTVIYRANQFFGCFKVCTRRFCIDPIGDEGDTPETNIFLRFLDNQSANLYRYELKHDLPANAEVVNWQFYPVNKPEEAQRVEGSDESVDLDKNKGDEYTICLSFEKDGCVRIICDNFCLDFPSDMCTNSDIVSCSSNEPFVTSELKCEKGEVDIKVELPSNYEIAYWIDDRGECFTSTSYDITVYARGERGVDQFLDCYYRSCDTCCISVERIPIPYCIKYLPCNSTLSSTLDGRPNEFTLENLNLNTVCQDQLSSCTFTGVDEIIEFEKTGESFVLNLRHGENGLSLFVLDSAFNAVNVLDADGGTICKGQNVDAGGLVVPNNQSVGEIFTDIYSPLPKGQYYAVIQGGCLDFQNYEDDYSLELVCVCPAVEIDFGFVFSPEGEVGNEMNSCERSFTEGTEIEVKISFDDSLFDLINSDIDRVELYMNDQLVSGQSSGEWLIPDTLTSGTYELEMRLTDKCGNNLVKSCRILISESVCESGNNAYARIMYRGREIAGMVVMPETSGYYMVSTSGEVFTFGGAKHFGSAEADISGNEQITGMAAKPDGEGYWLVSNSGVVYPFGSASFYGPDATPVLLNGAIVGIASTATGAGYWLISSEGKVFAFGDAEPVPQLSFSNQDFQIVEVYNFVEDGIAIWGAVTLKGETYSYGRDLFSEFPGINCSRNFPFYEYLSFKVYTVDGDVTARFGGDDFIVSGAYDIIHIGFPEQNPAIDTLSFINSCGEVLNQTCLVQFLLTSNEPCDQTDVWFDFEGDRTSSNSASCVMTYTVGHDLSVKLGSDNISAIQSATLHFKGEEYSPDETIPTFEWTNIDTNMALGHYPISMTVLTYCEAITRECTVVIAPEEEPCTDLNFSINNQIQYPNSSSAIRETECAIYDRLGIKVDIRGADIVDVYLTIKDSETRIPISVQSDSSYF